MNISNIIQVGFGRKNKHFMKIPHSDKLQFINKIQNDSEFIYKFFGVPYFLGNMKSNFSPKLC